MKEYKIKICGCNDFVVISPETLFKLISKIHSSSSFDISVKAKEIISADLSEYLLKVINSNRFENEHFRYRHILTDPIKKQELYQIMRDQLNKMDMKKTPCFNNIILKETLLGEAGFDIVCNETFFWACRNSIAKFIYTYADGCEKSVIIEF